MRATGPLAALMLCDAFQNGGTMEIRFDRKVLLRVPKKNGKGTGPPRTTDIPRGRFLRACAATAARRVARRQIPGAITPSEARALFEAITPMPPSSRSRMGTVTATYGLTPERVCFALLRACGLTIELDLLLATSARAVSILAGGALDGSRGAPGRGGGVPGRGDDWDVPQSASMRSTLPDRGA